MEKFLIINPKIGQLATIERKAEQTRQDWRKAQFKALQDWRNAGVNVYLKKAK